MLRVDSAAARSRGSSALLPHDFHTETSAAEYVYSGVQNTTLTIEDGLVEVETVQVERHGAYAQCGEPDTVNRPCCEEEVQ